MIWAIKDNQKILAEPKSKATCEICNSEVISKCGKIKVWHWAHKTENDCDAFGEPETPWHLNWKKLFPKECQEIRIENHRADIKTKKGIVIELQNSPLSSDKIIEREKFYQNMIWVLNSSTLCSGLNLRKKGEIITFRWKNPPKSWWHATKPIVVDTGLNWQGHSLLFVIKKIYHNIPCGGYGKLIKKEDWVNGFL